MTAHARKTRALVFTAIVGLTIAGVAAPLSAQAAARQLPRAHRAGLVTSREYTIVALGTNTITVADPLNGGTQYTVTLSPTASVVRRYNGKSSFAELSVKDLVTLAPQKVVSPGAPGAIEPTPAAGTAFATPALITRVKDWSLQMAYTQVAGKILAVNGSQLSLQLTATQGHNVAAFQVGETITVNVPSGTAVYQGKTISSMAALQPGVTLRTWGLSDSATGVLTAKVLHIVPSKAAAQTDPATGASSSDGGSK